MPTNPSTAMANYDFGPFHYDPEQRLLFRDGNVVSLAPKAIDTLHILLERRGRVIDKAELIKLLWPDTTVEEIGLARNISILRKALEQGGDNAYIETVPKRGYRFTAESAGVPPAPRVPNPRWILSIVFLVIGTAFVYWQFYVPSRYFVHRARVAALAVVPFESYSQQQQSVEFAHGITDILVADLAQSDRIEVLSPSTVRRHQRYGISMGLMGRLLGLDALVEGTVQKIGTDVNVSTRLVDVHTGRVIWAEYYAIPAGQQNAESELAQDVSAKIIARMANKNH